MKYILISIFILGLLSSFAYADNLSNYPDFFIKDDKLNVIIVVGDKAPATHVLAQTEIALSLSSLVSERNVGLTKLASEVDDFESINIISLGSACDNEITSEILRNPAPCDKNIEPGTSTIEFYEDEAIHIVLNSDSDAGIRGAASILSNYQNFELDGNIFVIEFDEEPKIITIENGEDVIISDDNENIVVEDKKRADGVEILEIEEKNSDVNENDEENKVEKSQITSSVEKNIIAKFISWFFSLFRR